MAVTRWLNNDFYRLLVFLAPLAFAELAVDVAEQVLNRSIAKGEDVVEVLAGFGLAYVFAKFFVGVLGEAKQASLVLVHDRWTFFKTMIYFLVCGVFVFVLLLVTALTQLGVWLIQDLHGVSPRVTDQARLALALLAFYPTIDLISWYHAGLLMQYHHSTVVGIASLADITAQIVSVAGLVFTPLLCNNTIAIPIIAAYCGVIVRCVINVAACYKMTFKLLSPRTRSPVSLWRLTTFISPLMLALAVQRISRPIVNLLVARFSPSACAADTALAVLTACYPVGRLPFGWLNQLRLIPPAFQKKPRKSEDTSSLPEKSDNFTRMQRTGLKKEDRKPVQGWKVGVFCAAVLGVSATASIILFWVPGLSVIIMRDVVGISEYLALLCVNPLRIFSLFCFTVATRAALTGWLTLYHQTKLVIPSALIRLAAILGSLFALPYFGVTGALMGVTALFLGFLVEAIFVAIFSIPFAVWIKCGSKCSKSSSGAEMKNLSSQVANNEKKNNNSNNRADSSEATTTASLELNAMITGHADVDKPIQDAAAVLVKQSLENAVEKLATKASDLSEVTDNAMKQTGAVLVKASLENAVEQIAKDETLETAVVLTETTLENEKKETMSDETEIVEIDTDQKTAAMLVKKSLENAVKQITTEGSAEISTADQCYLRDTAVGLVRNAIENAVVASESIGFEDQAGDGKEKKNGIITELEPPGTNEG